ncbi:MAG: hypothetical protein J7642_21215 [Cyanobacteria bacterium SBC]|nr:hypothetical protein [Cyanobacteria bacterium SBC]
MQGNKNFTAPTTNEDGRNGVQLPQKTPKNIVFPQSENLEENLQAVKPLPSKPRKPRPESHIKIARPRVGPEVEQRVAAFRNRMRQQLRQGWRL